MTNKTTMKAITQEFTESLRAEDIEALVTQYIETDEEREIIKTYMGNLYLLLDTLVQNTIQKGGGGGGGKRRRVSYREWFFTQLPELPRHITPVVESVYDVVWATLKKAVRRLLNEVHDRQIPAGYPFTDEYILLEYFYRHPELRPEQLLDPILAKWIRDNLPHPTN